jgi:hypothetical protein
MSSRLEVRIAEAGGVAERPSGSQQTPVPKTQIFSEQEPMPRLVHETRAQLQVPSSQLDGSSGSWG